ncbi:hypothetical protein B0H11DRAFT_1921961 [Mycena galericulata]|nr:hypothetical protein B0H11DRAFT_1921961 [Mycena galericulata]
MQSSGKVRGKYGAANSRDCSSTSKYSVDEDRHLRQFVRRVCEERLGDRKQKRRRASRDDSVKNDAMGSQTSHLTPYYFKESFETLLNVGISDPLDNTGSLCEKKGAGQSKKVVSTLTPVFSMSPTRSLGNI